MENKDVNNATEQLKQLAIKYKSLLVLLNSMNDKNGTDRSLELEEDITSINNEADVSLTRGVKTAETNMQIKSPTINTPSNDIIKKYEVTWKRIIENYKQLKASKK